MKQKILVAHLNDLTERIGNAAELLQNHDDRLTPRIQAKLAAVQEAEGVWEQERAKRNKPKHLSKTMKSFVSYLDYQMKHSTGGAREGYSLLLDYTRLYA